MRTRSILLKTIRGVSLRVAQDGTEREAAIDLNTGAFAMAELLLEHEKEIDWEASSKMSELVSGGRTWRYALYPTI